MSSTPLDESRWIEEPITVPVARITNVNQRHINVLEDRLENALMRKLHQSDPAAPLFEARIDWLAYAGLGAGLIGLLAAKVTFFGWAAQTWDARLASPLPRPAR